MTASTTTHAATLTCSFSDAVRANDDEALTEATTRFVSRLVAASDAAAAWTIIDRESARASLHADLLPVVDRILHGGNPGSAVSSRSWSAKGLKNSEELAATKRSPTRTTCTSVASVSGRDL